MASLKHQTKFRKNNMSKKRKLKKTKRKLLHNKSKKCVKLKMTKKCLTKRIKNKKIRTNRVGGWRRDTETPRRRSPGPPQMRDPPPPPQTKVTDDSPGPLQMRDLPPNQPSNTLSTPETLSYPSTRSSPAPTISDNIQRLRVHTYGRIRKGVDMKVYNGLTYNDILDHHQKRTLNIIKKRTSFGAVFIINTEVVLKLFEIQLPYEDMYTHYALNDEFIFLCNHNTIMKGISYSIGTYEILFSLTPKKGMFTNMDRVSHCPHQLQVQQ